jgi:hypothetical protein
MSGAPGAHGSDGPVTVAVSRTIRPGAEAAFEEWLRGVCHVATRFAGHMGVSVLPPAHPQSRTYVLIFRFDTLEHLTAWNESAERSEWIERVRPLTTGEPHVQVTTGLEHWFPLPEAGLAPPARYKMALLTWVVLFPLILLFSAAVAPYLAVLPPPLPTALTTAAMVILMTYVVMPRVTKLLRGWLFGG